MERRKPLIAVTMGDPAGVGPEIIVGAWSESVVHEWCRPVVIGHPGIMRRALKLWGLKQKVVEVASPELARPSPDAIPCISCGGDDALEVRAGQLDARAGQAAYDAVATATRLALDKKVDAIATAPLQKEALYRAGHEYPGHTELLAHVCGVEDYAMMLYLGPSEDRPQRAGLAVVHVTLHTAMKNVFGQLTEDAILAKARLADQFMSQLMCHDQSAKKATGAIRAKHPKDRSGKWRLLPFSRPRIGVCSLNPHGGEGGLFGDEEIKIIRPAVERGRAEGLLLDGPLPADTLMVQARDGTFDAVVAMYHDQGHIALKLLGMHRAVNVTLGLPIIRTSVAHGTAFDIAWRRRAETGGMIEALRVASLLAEAREK
ncbi:MAG: 4-hydroxythreonine-4-phosphate dehydrogenase PdxA [Pirellulales bacterium]|nr:4-hydroxythreonine-4-phosphate dehydrogenase PdxA [Pirellulales bacterium]